MSITCYFGCPLSLLLQVYDFLLTIRLEITLLWFTPWSYTKILYLLVRYLPIGTIYFELRSGSFSLPPSAEPDFHIMNIFQINYWSVFP